MKIKTNRKTVLFLLLLTTLFLKVTTINALEAITVSVITGEKIVELSVKLARNPANHIALDDLVMPFDKESKLYIFGKEEVKPVRAHKDIPMDVLLIGKNGTIKEILGAVPPLLTPVSVRPHAAVLKMASDSCEILGIKIGDHVYIPGVKLSNKRSVKPDDSERKQLETILKNSIKDNPKDHKNITALGKFYLANGEPEKTVTLINKSKDKTVEQLVTLAVAYRKQGQLQNFEKTLIDAIKIDPTFIASYEQLILLNSNNQMALNSIIKVTQLLTQTLKEHKSFETGRILLFKLLLSQNNLNLARKTIDDAPVKTPEINRAYGDLFLREGEYGLAAIEYFKFIKARPYHQAVKDMRIFITVHYPKTEGKK